MINIDQSNQDLKGRVVPLRNPSSTYDMATG